MSSTSTPLPSQFVCGTAGSPDVYYLSAGTRRLIPDSQTTLLLLAGQAIRIISEADLAAIPLGAAMPTRKDGSLLTQQYPTPPPSIVLYFMARGLRRRVPDIETQTEFARSGPPILQVDAADLAEIPEGLALPTRKDGTLYKGSGKPFAYEMQGGLKLAFPNAATLRDAGHDLRTLLPISADDLTFIPDGAAFPSTSKFLSPPGAEVPLVLLPVRLETRIHKTSDTTSELWLRIYPDDIHVNSFEPLLTADEQIARANYASLAAADVETRQAAFASVARQFGAARAAWITSAEVPVGTKKTDWTIAPFTNALPERWIVIGYQGDGPGQLLATGNPIADSLTLGPVLDDSGNVKSDDTKWISDFNTAIRAGMAFRIPLTPVQQRGFKRIVVLGLKTGLNAKDSALLLAELLQAHHYTDGLELLANNTPTNNTDDVSSGFATKDPDSAQLFALEQGPSLCPSRPTADGDRLARALNIAPATFAHVNGANGAQDEQAQAMNTVLWPATWGYYLGQIVTGAVPTPDVLLPAARDHFAGHVRARGHFPAMRIGRQPYGILPVCWSANWIPLEGGALEALLFSLLTQLRTIWRQYIAGVPRIPKATDPEAELVELLGMTPSTSSTVARSVLGPEYSFAYWNYVRSDLTAEWWTDLAAQVRTDGSALAAAMAKTRLANATYTTWHRALSDLIVALDSPDSAKGYITALAAMGWQALIDATAPPAPIPILFLLLRHAALREYLDTALDLLIADNVVQESERIEAELVGFAGTALRPTASDLLGNPLANRGAVGDVLDKSKNDPTLPAFVAYWKAFSQLALYSAADLDAATREVFDLSSYRLDSWISSLAHYRLDQTRNANSSGGIVLGAYGWLENVGNWPDEVPTLGYVHAPSLNQSTTTAILRSGYLSHQGGEGKPFEIDLSSARVRLALHILDGIRQGQTLGALLGYRLERTLQDMAPKEPGLYDLIDKLRSIAPMDAASQLDVVDGLALFRMAADPNVSATWSATLSATLQNALTTGLTMLGDALDSVADLTLTESVHQLIRGNTLRAGATLDSVARGDSPPPEIDFVTTPRSGTALTYRLMTIAAGDKAPGWTITPRAQAEPRLNAWAAALLGDPSLVRIRARFVGADGKGLLSLEIGLNQLALAPVDLLSYAETQGIAGELAERITRVIAQARPASVPANASVEILSGRDPAWPSQRIGLPEWLALVNAITRMTGAARPLEPADLVAQGDTAGTIDTAELQGRADAAETQMRAGLAALQTPTASDVALMSAAAYGVAGAVPALDASLWPAQIKAASLELASRAQALDKLAAGFDRSTAPSDSLRDQDTARLKAIFGTSFVVLPIMAPGVVANWPQLWANSTSLQVDDTLAAVRWMQRASRVRAGAGYMDTALMYAEAFAGRTLLQLDVAQLPVAANDRWVALDGPTDASPNTLSLVAFSPTPFSAGAALAGLMVDEWLEVWPSTDQTTGVTFQYSDPIARAPQTVLLAVRPDHFPEWTLESVEGSVLEALDLAKIRGADPDVLFGDAPPVPIDANVTKFQAISDTEAFVLGTDGSLWLEQGPFGTVPPVRELVDSSVSSFQALSDTSVFVLRTDGTLLLEHGPFGTGGPAPQTVDQNVTLVPPTPPVIIIPPPTQITVPSFITMYVTQATAAVIAAGLVPKIDGFTKSPGPGWGIPKVTSQIPVAGTQVDKGTQVTLVTVSTKISSGR